MLNIKYMRYPSDPRYALVVDDGVYASNDGDICIGACTLACLKDVDNSFCIDIGSNVGNWSKLVMKNDANTKLLSFEANPVVFETLVENMKEYKNCECLNMAISDTDGSIPISLENEQSNSRGTSADSVNVPCRKLIDYIKDVDHVDFLKIDTEGHELKVLSSVINDLDKIHNLVLEFNPQWYNSAFLTKEYLKRIINSYETVYHVSRRMPIELHPVTMENMEAFYDMCVGNNFSPDLFATNDGRFNEKFTAITVKIIG